MRMRLSRFLWIAALPLMVLSSSLAHDTVAADTGVAKVKVSMNEASEIAAVVSRVPFYTPEASVATDDEFYASSPVASEIDSGTLLAAIVGLVGLRLWGRSKKTLRAIG